MFLKVYLTPDTRLQANAWIENTIKSESIIITEGANVVDLPFNTSRYQVKSFFLYDLDKNPVLASKVFNTLEKADYVVVPSRRVFANYTCYLFKKEQIVNKPNCSLNRKYPKIAKYYRELFLTGKFQLLKTFSVLDDEYSEETFTVFDHPYVRIFKRRIN